MDVDCLGVCFENERFYPAVIVRYRNTLKEWSYSFWRLTLIFVLVFGQMVSWGVEEIGWYHMGTEDWQWNAQYPAEPGRTGSWTLQYSDAGSQTRPSCSRVHHPIACSRQENKCRGLKKEIVKPLSHWTKCPLTPTNIWLLSVVGKGAISSSPGNVSAPFPADSNGNMTPGTIFQTFSGEGDEGNEGLSPQSVTSTTLLSCRFNPSHVPLALRLKI